MFTIHGYACEIQGESGSGKMEDGHEGAKAASQRDESVRSILHRVRPPDTNVRTRVSPVAQIFACHDPVSREEAEKQRVATAMEPWRRPSGRMKSNWRQQSGI